MPVVVPACGTLVTLIAFANRASFRPFLQPVSDGLGWRREVFAIAVAIQNRFRGLSQPVAGAIADKYGWERVVAVCAADCILGLALMSGVTEPVAFTLCAGVTVGIGVMAPALDWPIDAWAVLRPGAASG